MLSSIGRAAIRRGGAGASYSSTNRAAQSIWSLQRVTFSQGANESSTKSTFAIAFPRSYATATKTVTKPKKTTPTKAKPKTKTAAKTKAKAKKPVKKPAKKKPAKPKAKKTKKPVKKVLTDDQKERVAIKVLKQKALSPPAGLPENAWMVLIRENRALTKGSNNVGEFSTAISAKYKSLSPEEKESLNQIANDNKIANQAAFSKWLQTHTPEQIKDANNARQLLKRKLKKSGAKLHDVSLIADPRLPKRAGTALSYFLKDRHASGDFKGIKIGDAGKLISQEWKTLPAGERKVYEDRANADKQRYIQEFKTVYHRESSATV